MKYKNEVEINLPLQRVIELIGNPEKLKHGFLSYDPSGNASEEDSPRMKMKYKIGKREIDLIEIIVKKDACGQPDTADSTYAMGSRISDRFVKVSENKTKWIAENVILYDGLKMKIVGFLRPSVFKKQSQIYLNKFKEFAESHG